ncbi:MAG TPA: bifunctional serine/threonine-protein kinase/formylglycine-generating enzyme family protein [Bryobacterales bacterium]|nr:bifunctional serine/threonine-protein kinase/formylglycine-generating enzyme family protein [Bryobacterales bacterium]
MPTREQTHDLLAAVIGSKYEVLQWIGGGGMADVFLARHRIHGGLFAVKVLADRLASDPAIVGRFLQEARTAASLSGHANIVSIFDVGEEQGLHYLIMQYVEGEDLASYLQREGRLAPHQAAQVVAQVAKALVGAHAKGVTHRDLKPANIRLDRYGRVVVLDFGIAKARDVPSTLTGTGERLGTPYYMSPEQIRGEACGPPSDLYSLGVVFFELLTGRKPFDGQTWQAIEYAHLYNAPPSPAQSDPSIGAEYSSIVLRLLEKDPGARYRSATELLEDLKKLDPGGSTAAIEPLVPPELRQWSEAAPPSEAPTVRATQPAPAAAASRTTTRRRLKTQIAIAAAGAAILAIALVVAVTARRRSAPPASAAARSLPAEVDAPTGKMLLVAAGAFTFGSNTPESANPPQIISLVDFYIDQTEVSNAAYKQFCDATGHAPPDAPPWEASYFLSKPDYPVVNVSLEDAQAFAAWAGKRIPSEREWEKAARGSDARTYPWGDSPPSGQAGLANMEGRADGYENTAPVSAFAEGRSPWGAFNLAGNVWEWTADPYPVTPKEIADMNKLLPSVGPAWRVIKGGNFTSPELWLRAYMRRGFPAAGHSPYIGFRCVKDAP